MDYFNLFLVIMSVIAVIVFIALYFVNAAYGIMFTSKWGPSVTNKLGWILMEAPVFVVMTIFWMLSSRQWEPVYLCFFLFFQLHYVQRAFVFPFLMKGNGRMPLSILLMGVLFNVLNGCMQGGWIFYVSPMDYYTPDWFFTPQFIIGTLLFFVGMGVNWHSDYIIRSLRGPNDIGHYLPQGGMFRYVSSANYFGELVEWIGFAVLTWSWAGVVFAWWTFANLAPRAAAIYTRYEDLFGEEFRQEHRKRIIPFIY